MKIGRYVQQPSGYKAFIPYEFPLPNIEKLGSDIITKHSKAIRLVGKLDGITELLPDKDWFLTMFIISFPIYGTIHAHNSLFLGGRPRRFLGG